MRYIGITGTSDVILEVSLRPREDQWKRMVSDQTVARLEEVFRRHEQWKEDQDYLFQLLKVHPELEGKTVEQIKDYIEEKLVECAALSAAPPEGSGWPP